MSAALFSFCASQAESAAGYSDLVIDWTRGDYHFCYRSVGASQDGYGTASDIEFVSAVRRAAAGAAVRVLSWRRDRAAGARPTGKQRAHSKAQ